MDNQALVLYWFLKGSFLTLSFFAKIRTYEKDDRDQSAPDPWVLFNPAIIGLGGDGAEMILSQYQFFSFF